MRDDSPPLLNFLHVVLPVFSIKGNDPKSRQDIVIETAQVDVEAVGMRSRSVKGMNPTALAKQMFGNFGIEGVKLQHLFSLQ